MTYLREQTEKIIDKDITCFGCSVEDIHHHELSLNIKLPSVYKEFLSICGMTSGHLFCGCKVEMYDTNYINTCGRESYKEALGINCSGNIYFIMEHHGYSYYYFDLREGDNPDIWILVHGDEITHKRIGKLAQVLNEEIERL